MGVNYLWMYWENVAQNTRAPWLDLCLETIRSKSDGLELSLLSRDSVFEVLPELDRRTWQSLATPTFRADYARAHLLLRYGGIWVDIDTLAMAPLVSLLGEVDESGIVGWGADSGGRFYTGLIAASPGSPFVSAWVEAIERRVYEAQSSSRGLSYAALGQEITRDLSKSVPSKSLDRAKVAPIMYDRWRQVLSPYLAPSAVLRSRPYTVILWNAAMGGTLSRFSKHEVLASRMLLGRLLRIALGIKTVEEEELDYRIRLSPLARLRYSDFGYRVERRLSHIGRLSHGQA